MKSITIRTCFDCPHRGHSGRFTPGGAIPLCNKCPDKNARYNRKELPWEPGVTPRGTPTRKATGVIPNWCPL